MVVDTSALLAVVLGEDDAARYLDQLVGGREAVLVSAASLVEAGIVAEARQGPDAGRDLRLLLELIGAQVQPVDEAQAHLAIAAWRRFGKGRHPASLNLGDCFAYALARMSGEPILFKGEDFAQTDLAAALAG